MEILKQGDITRLRKTKRFICKKCGCEFIAEKSEYELASQLEWFDTGSSAHCKCPCCGSAVYTR